MTERDNTEFNLGVDCGVAFAASIVAVLTCALAATDAPVWFVAAAVVVIAIVPVVRAVIAWRRFYA